MSNESESFNGKYDSSEEIEQNLPKNTGKVCLTLQGSWKLWRQSKCSAQKPKEKLAAMLDSLTQRVLALEEALKNDRKHALHQLCTPGIDRKCVETECQEITKTSMKPIVDNQVQLRQYIDDNVKIQTKFGDEGHQNSPLNISSPANATDFIERTKEQCHSLFGKLYNSAGTNKDVNLSVFNFKFVLGTTSLETPKKKEQNITSYFEEL